MEQEILQYPNDEQRHLQPLGFPFGHEYILHRHGLTVQEH